MEGDMQRTHDLEKGWSFWLELGFMKAKKKRQREKRFCFELDKQEFFLKELIIGDFETWDDLIVIFLLSVGSFFIL